MALLLLSDVGRLPNFNMTNWRSPKPEALVAVFNSSIANVGQCSRCHRRVQHGRKRGIGLVVGIESAAHPRNSYFNLRFDHFVDRHLEFWQSDNDGQCSK